MKQNIFLAIALCGCGATIKAQCDNGKLRYISNKTESLDLLKAIKDIRDEETMVELTKEQISIIPRGDIAEAMTGDFTDISCLWKDAFINGKTIIQANLLDAKGDPKTATITIESANGKITILVEAEELPGRKMRLFVNKHEELN